MPFLPEPDHNITQHANENFHAIIHQLNLLFVGLGHANHGEFFIERQLTRFN